MAVKALATIAKQFDITEPEPEAFILTPEECDRVIKNEIESQKKYRLWKWITNGATEHQARLKLASIDWDKEIDRDKILSIANSNKHQALWHENRRKEERERELKYQQELAERCDAKYMFKLMKWTSKNVYGKDLIVTEHNKHFIAALCYFLSGDERFETELGFSRNKGLLIRGISGLGKTHLVKCLERNELNPILILSMIEITDHIKEHGEYHLNLEGKKVVYLDDVGTEEPTVNHYGTKISFFKNFVELVYLKNQNRTFSKLMISTNNSFDEIEDKYGFRVRSRMKDMFNLIDVFGEDMRG